jgi:hypothetical protein
VQRTDQNSSRTETGNASMLEHITDELDRLFQTGQNVIISEEILARATFDIPTFQQATTKWQVLIVVAYRQL